MLTGRGGEDIAHHLEPQSCERAHPILACVLVLRTQRLLQITAMVGTEVEREEAHERTEQAPGTGSSPRTRAHTDLGRDTSFFVRAISTIDSSLSISAAATLRPNGVSR